VTAFDVPASTRLDVNGITLNVIDAGDSDGPAVLLLHGFPDRALMWRAQIEALVGAGYRVIAPDLRGFGDSDRPVGVEAYDLSLIIGDVLGLLDLLEVGRVRVGAHDWGALVGWVVTALAPDRVERFAAFSVGHPRAFAGAGFEQKQLSWYMLWWQFPDVAETVMPQDDWRWYREWAYEGASRADDAELHRQLNDLQRPGALTSGLNWYRANVPPLLFADEDRHQDLPTIACPVLGVWGDREMALTERQMTDSPKFISGPWRYERLTGVGHWIPAHAPRATSDLLIDFFAHTQGDE
jgi:pimeloyl-ACP methyl ester carboxylesterase